MKTVDVIRIGLLFFVCASITVLAVRAIVQTTNSTSNTVSIGDNHGADRVIVYSTHAKVRCPSCVKMEKWTRKTLDTFFAEEQSTGKIEWRELDYEAAENTAFAQRHKIATATVLLVRIKNGTESESANFAADAWKFLGDEEQFMDTIRGHIQRFITEEKTPENGWHRRCLRTVAHVPKPTVQNHHGNRPFVATYGGETIVWCGFYHS